MSTSCNLALIVNSPTGYWFTSDINRPCHVDINRPCHIDFNASRPLVFCPLHCHVQPRPLKSMWHGLLISTWHGLLISLVNRPIKSIHFIYWAYLIAYLIAYWWPIGGLLALPPPHKINCTTDQPKPVGWFGAGRIDRNAINLLSIGLLIHRQIINSPVISTDHVMLISADHVMLISTDHVTLISTAWAEHDNEIDPTGAAAKRPYLFCQLHCHFQPRPLISMWHGLLISTWHGLLILTWHGLLISLVN